MNLSARIKREESFFIYFHPTHYLRFPTFFFIRFFNTKPHKF